MYTNWLETMKGSVFRYDKISCNKILIEDIAQALSMQCRYNGLTTRFYSVAEHCKLLANYAHYKLGLSPQICLTILLHDASETYMGDMVGPLKQMFPKFKEMENKIDALVAKTFGTIYPFPDIVKELDSRICVDEHKQAFPYSTKTWGFDHLEPLNISLDFSSPSKAHGAFVNAFDFFYGIINNDERDAREAANLLTFPR